MLAAARLVFRLSAPGLLEAAVTALRTHPQPPFGRPAHASGRTERALRTQETDTSLTLYGPAHVQTLLTGRGPSRGAGGGRGRPLHEILAQWAKDKPGFVLRPNQTYAQVGRALAYKIHRQGTALHRLGQPSGLFAHVFDEEIQRLKQRVASSEATALSSELRHLLAA